jgi:hypothetical protein
VDIAGAARATGLSVKAIRGRVERGSLPATLVGGRRRIPVDALLAAGLLAREADREVVRGAPATRGEVTELRDALAAQTEELAAIRAELSRLIAAVQISTWT